MKNKKSVFKTILLITSLILINIGIIVLGWIIGVNFLVKIIGENQSETENYKEDIIELAKENALSYVKDKYEFTPEIISAEANIYVDSTMFGKKELTGTADIIMEYNGKKFTVEISGKEKTNYGYDNYQYDIIYNDVLHLLKKEIGYEPTNFILNYGEYKDDLYDSSSDAEWKKYAINGKINELYNDISDFSDYPMTIVYEYSSDNKLNYSNIKKYFYDSSIIIINKKNSEVFIDTQRLLDNLIRIDNYLLEFEDDINSGYIWHMEREIYFVPSSVVNIIGNIQIKLYDKDYNSIDVDKTVITNNQLGLDFWKKYDENIKSISDEFEITTNYEKGIIKLITNEDPMKVKLCTYDDKYLCIYGKKVNNYIQFGLYESQKLKNTKFVIAYF